MNAMIHPPVYLHRDEPLTAAALESIARGAGLQLAPEHWDAVARCRAFVEVQINERRRIYGVTTGYGPLAHTFVDPAASARLQQGLVNHLSAGVGALLERASVRAIMAARAAMLARGHSGVRVETLQLLLDCLAADLVPQVPAIGTVGASGDLTPLAHITGALMGQGQVWLRGEAMPAAEALARTGLTALEPAGKDALALVNGTSAMTAIAALNQCRARRALELSAFLTVLYGELLDARLEALQPGLAELRPHPGQLWAQRSLLALAAPSRRLQAVEQPPPRLPDAVPGNGTLQQQPMPQDAYTFRCAPQHLGAVFDTLAFHGEVVAQELHAVTDNPVFLPERGEVLHGGNFFGQHIALAADALNNALLTLAIHSERRIARITDPLLNNGLPAFLRGREDGLNSGFMGAQVSATALVAEMRAHAHPASIQSIATNANNQDVVTLGTLAARRCGETLEHLSALLAIESLILVQGMELAGDDGFAPASRDFAGLVRSRAAALDEDRPLSGDIQTIQQLLDSPALLDPLLRRYLPR